MNTKKFLLSTLAAFVGLMVATFLLEEVIFKGNFTAMYQSMGAATIEMSSVPIIAFLAPIAIVSIMVYIYPKGYEGGSHAVEGFRFGVLLGLILGIAFGVFFELLFGVGTEAVLIQILVSTLEIGVTGLIIGLVYGRD